MSALAFIGVFFILLIPGWHKLLPWIHITILMVVIPVLSHLILICKWLRTVDIVWLEFMAAIFLTGVTLKCVAIPANGEDILS